MSPRIRSWARSLYWLLLTLAACAPPAVQAPRATSAALSCIVSEPAPTAMVVAFDPQSKPAMRGDGGAAAACRAAGQGAPPR